MTDQKRIAKNALMLFFRTFITIGISLYVSRKLLLILGESDFGIYSVVGGIAVIFSFLESAIFSGAQRFLSLSLKESRDTYIRCFTTCLNSYLLLGGIVLLLSETIGVYIVNYVLNIPPERMVTANWVFQFAVFTVIITLTNGPYKASIIAYERFSYFARIDVVVKLLQLGLVIWLAYCTWDQLVVYSVIMMVLAIVRAMVDKIYCHHQFEGCRYIKYFDKKQFASLLSFAGWTVCKSASESGVNQGNNIIVNIFGGTIASASMGLGNQIWGTIAGFVNNIHVAYTSQIIQYWGTENRSDFSKLIIDSMRYSSYMLIAIGIPFLANTEYILRMWLSEIPDYAVSFCQLSFLSSVLYSLANPVNTGVQATGRIKWYQIIGSFILLIDLPLAYILLYIGGPLSMVLIVRICVQVILLIYNVYYLHAIDEFPAKTYIYGVLKIMFAAFVSYMIAWLVITQIGNDSFINVLTNVVIGLIVSSFLLWKLSLMQSEKKELIKYIKRIVHI